jgi:thiosulfate reductase cytochrome b subunit
MKTPGRKEYHHPPIIRITHWLNALALLIMITSGMRIYNASPLFGFAFPDVITLGGWLAGARMWHFFGMWLFAVNGVVYVLYNILSKHGRRTTLFRKSDVPGVLPMILYYLRIRREHPPQQKYNALQKLAYTVVPLLALGGIMTGISIYWPVQFSSVASLFGGYDTARLWHFIFMSTLVLFIVGHLVMVTIAGWNNFVSMITGWRKFPASAKPSLEKDA